MGSCVSQCYTLRSCLCLRYCDWISELFWQRYVLFFITLFHSPSSSVSSWPRVNDFTLNNLDSWRVFRLLNFKSLFVYISAYFIHASFTDGFSNCICCSSIHYNMSTYFCILMILLHYDLFNRYWQIAGFCHRFYLWSLSNDSRRKNAREISRQTHWT